MDRRVKPAPDLIRGPAMTTGGSPES